MGEIFNSYVFNNYINVLIIIHQNIRSTRKNFDLFVLNMHKLDKMPNIIIVSEIWIQEYELEFYKLPNYDMFANHVTL